MKRITKNTASKAFTLIELLIVIVIIGILAGAVIAVINPAQMQRKAREAVMRTNVEKGCLALNACGSTSDAIAGCDTPAELGLTLASITAPTGAEYTLPVTATTVKFVGTMGTCTYTCTYDFSSASPANTIVPAVGEGDCLVK
jgi:prepilin-type N-terminal cleavage/methylation domain-containing protein